MAHAGKENGKLKVRKKDFVDFGIHNNHVAPAEREAVALGLAILTKRGRAGHAEHRAAHEWALSFIKDGRGTMASTAWKRFHSLKEAKATATKARTTKDTTAVAIGKRRAAKRRKLRHFPVSQTDTKVGITN